MFKLPFFQSLSVDTAGVVDGSVPLSNPDTDSSSSSEVLTGVHSHITITLYNESLPDPTHRQTHHVHEMHLLDEVVQTMKDSTTSSSSSPVNSSLIDRFPSNTGGR